MEGLRSIDLHGADGICCTASHSQIEECREDRQADHVERELVVQLYRAEDLAARGARRGDEGESAEEAVHEQRSGDHGDRH